MTSLATRAFLLLLVSTPLLAHAQERASYDTGYGVGYFLGSHIVEIVLVLILVVALVRWIVVRNRRQDARDRESRW